MSEQSQSQQRKNKTILFVDPGSKSTGWSLFIGQDLAAHGTIQTDATKEVDRRLFDIGFEYWALFADGIFQCPDECHIEQLVRNTHIMTHWSVGAIMHNLACWCKDVRADVSISAWQKAAKWKKTKRPIKKLLLHPVKSEDELAAIGMGYYWTRKKK